MSWWGLVISVETTVSAAVSCANLLSEKAPDAARELCRAAEIALPVTADAADLASVGVTWSALDQTEGERVLDLAAERVAATPRAVPGYLRALERLPSPQAEERVRAVGALVTEDTDDHKATFVARAAWAASLARFDSTAAAEEIWHLIAVLPETAERSDESSKGIQQFVQLLRDLTGGSSSELPDLAQSAAEAVAALAKAEHPRAHEDARALIEVAHAQTRPDVRRDAALAVWRGLAGSASASADLASWPPSVMDEPERKKVVDVLSDAGRWDVAETLAADLTDSGSALEEIESARSAAASPTTVLERTLLETADSSLKGLTGWAIQMAHSDECEEALAQLLAAVTDPDFQEPRLRVLGDFAPCVVPLLLATGGTVALDKMVDAFADLDERLREAAALSAAN